MYAQNRPPVYSNGAVVIMNPPGRPGAAGGGALHPMPPTRSNGGVARRPSMSQAAGPNGSAYMGMPGRQDRFLPVIQAQRPPYMQHPPPRPSIAVAPYMGVYGTRQVFAPQPPPGQPSARGASAPRALPRGCIPIRPPGAATDGDPALRRASADLALNNEASQADSFTSTRQSFSDARSGTIVVPFNGHLGSGDSSSNVMIGGATGPIGGSASAVRFPQQGRRHQHQQPPQHRQLSQLPSLNSASGASLRHTSAAPSAYNIDAAGSGGQLGMSRLNDAGDIFTPLVDYSNDGDSSSSDDDGDSSGTSRSELLVSTSDSSPNGQYALSPELAANLNDYEDVEVQDYFPNVFFCGTRNCNKVLGIQGRPQNNGYDDDKNHYIITIGDHIGYRYEIQKELGRGTFGVVVRAYDHREQREVAVKIIKNKPSYTKQAKEEVDVLSKLQADDPNDEKNIVRLLHTLTFRNHFIIVFELLSIDLYNMVYKNGFRAMPMEFIYDFAEQMLTALEFVRDHTIVHCDFKPENIVVCHQTSLMSPGTNLKRLKLIDFGSACFDNRRVHTYIQSRYYRAPEVVLGIPYTAAIDMWSFGCVVCELANGYPIFPGSSEGDLLQRMVEYLGHVPKSVQARGKRSGTFYDDSGMQLRPKLSSMPSSAGVVPAKPHRFTGASSKSLSTYLQSARADRDDLFLDFVTGCLQFDPETRLSPRDALRHPWLEKWRRLRATRKSRGR